MNKIEEYTREKDGLDVLQDVSRYAAKGWEAVTEGDRERLKWTGVFFRKQTPGHFMMRIRIPNGISNAARIKTMAEISKEFGKGFADITTGSRSNSVGSQSSMSRRFGSGSRPSVSPRSRPA